MNNKPRITKDESAEILVANKVTDKVIIIGIRGYYQDGIGKRGENDRNVYDDAFIIISPQRFETFRANTDPSVYRKGIATMTTGVHRYYKGKHKNRYWALRLVGEKVSVTRDGQTGTKTGIALNIHKGGTRTTGSEGCQTLAPADWDNFIEIVYDEMAFYNQKTIPYVLIDEKERRRGAYKMPHLPTFESEEVDNLLIRLDKPEPAVSVGTTQNPALIPATIPQTSESASQPQILDESSKQPVQPGLENPLPSLGSYLTEAADKVAQAKETIGAATSAIDQIKIIKDALGTGDSKDGKKSLWSTIGQVIYQTAWAVVAFLIGLPLEVWIVVAVIAAIVGVMYLYRQNSLGKIRETARLELLKLADFLK